MLMNFLLLKPIQLLHLFRLKPIRNFRHIEIDIRSSHAHAESQNELIAYNVGNQDL